MYRDYASAYYEAASPSLLSQQPVTQKGKPKTPDEPDWVQSDWGAVYGSVETRLSMLRNWRYSWWMHWSLLAEYFLPRRWSWLVVPNRMWRGNPINSQIIDDTGLLAVRTCAAGLYSGLTNPARDWFNIGVSLPADNLDAEAKEWLDDTERRLYTVLDGSNFYNTMAQAFEDVTVFGTAPITIYEDYDNVIKCYLPCAGEYCLASSSRFTVDTQYREFNLTVAQIVEMFGLDNCPQMIKTLWQNGGGSIDSEYTIAHCIEPNFPIRVIGTDRQVYIVPVAFPWKELYWIRGMKTEVPLSVRGFTECPFVAMRWSVVSNEPYGRSPCMDALGDNRQVQRETERKAEFIEKGVRPPMGADPALKNEPSSIVPGQVTYFDTTNGNKGFFPLFEPQAQWLTGLTADIEMVNKRIEKALFVDLFMAITQMEGVQPRNELELAQRNMERLQVLGPFEHRFENECVGPALKRILRIMERKGLLAPLPKSLKGVPIKVNLITMTKIAQNSSESVAIKDLMTTAGQLSLAALQTQGEVPNPIRTLDLDKALREYADRNGAPQDLFLSEQQVKQQDQMRAKQKQAAAIPGAAQAAVQAAQTLSQTQLGGNTALSAAVGQPANAA